MSPIRKLLFLLCCADALAALFSAWSLHLESRRAPIVPADPWTAAQTVQPADFAKELLRNNRRQAHDRLRRLPRSLRRRAHSRRILPRRRLHRARSRRSESTGPSQSRAMPISYSTAAAAPSRTAPISVQPSWPCATWAFTHLRVLILPNDFNTDWIAKGYPVEKAE